VRCRAASLVALASLLIAACVGQTSTPSASPVTSASPVASASPTSAPAFEPNPPIQYLDPTTLFVGSFPNVLRSDDGGLTWTPLGAPPFARFDELRMIDRDRGWSILFFIRDQPQIGCQQAGTAAPCHSAIAVTSDGGRTWFVRLTSLLNPGGGASIDHLQAVDATHAWALVTTTCDQTGVCDKELRATADGGITWKTLRGGRLRQLRVASLARAWVSADAENGSVIYTTTDGGATWRQQLATEEPLVALDAASDTDAWALTEAPGYCTASDCRRNDLFVTRNGGVSWSSLGNPKANVVAGPSCMFGHLAGPLFASPQIGWLGVSRGVGGVSGISGVMRTDDGGRTWICSVAPPDVERVSAADPDHVLALSRDPQSGYALWLSTNGGRTWTPI
jgi:photosystem II stability/assembly factor-like uncharacterized protein